MQFGNLSRAYGRSVAVTEVTPVYCWTMQVGSSVSSRSTGLDLTTESLADVEYDFHFAASRLPTQIQDALLRVHTKINNSLLYGRTVDRTVWIHLSSYFIFQFLHVVLMEFACLDGFGGVAML